MKFRRGMYEALLNKCDQHWAAPGTKAAWTVVSLDRRVRPSISRLHAGYRPRIPMPIGSLRHATKQALLCPRTSCAVCWTTRFRWPSASGAIPTSMSLRPHSKPWPRRLAIRAAAAGECARSDQEKIQVSAARVLPACGLNDPVDFVLEREQVVGFENLTALSELCTAPSNSMARSAWWDTCNSSAIRAAITPL